MKKRAALGCLAILLLWAGCTARLVFTTHPGVQTLENDIFGAMLKPLKNENGQFDAFHLAVTNKTTQPIVIDWRKTHYILNSRANGRLMFEGISAQTIHEPPPDEIPAAAALSRVIWPVNLIAFAPYRSNSVRPGDTGFSRGKLPAGENGISLLVLSGDRRIRQQMTVTITVDRE